MMRMVFRGTGLALAGLALVACQPRTPPVEPGTSVAEAKASPSREPGGGDRLDDLGEPRGEVSEDESLDRPLSEVGKVEGVPVEHVDMDGEDPNGGPTDVVSVPPERTPSGSLLDPGMLAGPNK